MYLKKIRFNVLHISVEDQAVGQWMWIKNIKNESAQLHINFPDHDAAAHVKPLKELILKMIQQKPCERPNMKSVCDVIISINGKHNTVQCLFH